MMTKLPVSCFIIAKNEADRIDRGIGSVIDWIDDVVIVDGGSSDNTIAVAQKAGARVISRQWDGFGQQKRFAEDQCRYDWILNIDSDEVVTPELRREIEHLFAAGVPPFVAYGMQVCLVYPGATKPRYGARDHWCVRLYNRVHVRFRNSSVHDSVVVEGHDVGHLEAPLYHFSIRSYAHLKRKLDRRMWMSIQRAETLSPLHLAVRLVTEFPMHFFKYYIIRRHFTGGFDGLRYTSLQAKYRFFRIHRMIFTSWRAQIDTSQSEDHSDELIPECNKRNR